MTNSHQVFVVADADTKVRYTGAYHKKDHEDGMERRGRRRSNG